MKKGLMLLLGIRTVICFSSCNNKEEGLVDLTYSTKENITSFDQQFVEKTDVQKILRGISVPLVTFDSEGNIVPYVLWQGDWRGSSAAS